MSVNIWESPNKWASTAVNCQITEVFPSLTEAISVNITSGVINVSLVEIFPSPVEGVSVLIPGDVIINGKSIVRVSAKTKRSSVGARTTIKRVN